MAEAPTFSGFSSGDSAQTFAKVIAQIKADMAAIEASAKNIEGSLSKASRANISGGAGATGSSKPAFGDSSLGKISTQLGGAKGIGHATAFGIGSVLGGMGIGGTQGSIAGGLAVAGLPDLALRPERALDIENARFGVAQATGDFNSFQRMMDGARNSFNVQDQQAFRNTVVYGAQRAGMVGLNGGGTVGERRAAQQIGGYSTLAGMAGIDQSAVTGMMKTSLSAETYYSSMASGVMTRNPVTGETIGIEGQINQRYKQGGFAGMSKEKALTQIDINYGEGSTGRANLLNDYGGNEDMVDTVIEGFRIQARQGGKALTENQVQDQMKDIGEAGGLGTKKTQGAEGVRALENAKTGLDLETLDAATAGIEEATKHITNAVEYLTDLEGALETIRDGYVTMANQMDVFNTELPGATKGITDFLTGLPGLLLQGLGLKGLMGGGGGGGGGGIGRLGGRLLGMGARGFLGAGGGVGLGLAAVTVGVGLGGKYLVNRYTDYDEKSATTNNAISRNAGTQGSPGTSYNTSPTPSSSAGRTQSYTPGATYGSGYGRAKGDWFVEADQDDRIHYGEMVLPNRIASAVREELAVGKTSGGRATSKGSGGATVNIYLTIQRASDQEAMQFAGRVKRIIENDRELLAIGSGRLSSG